MSTVEGFTKLSFTKLSPPGSLYSSARDVDSFLSPSQWLFIHTNSDLGPGSDIIICRPGPLIPRPSALSGYLCKMQDLEPYLTPTGSVCTAVCFNGFSW